MTVIKMIRPVGNLKRLGSLTSVFSAVDLYLFLVPGALFGLASNAGLGLRRA